MMRKLLLMVTLFSLTSITLIDVSTDYTVQDLSEYNEGFEDGFEEGWKDVKGQFSLPPLPPLPSLPEVGLDTYRDGYNKGFKVGRRAAFKNKN